MDMEGKCCIESFFVILIKYINLIQSSDNKNQWRKVICVLLKVNRVSRFNYLDFKVSDVLNDHLNNNKIKIFAELQEEIEQKTLR